MLSAIAWAGGQPIPAHTLRPIERRCAGSGDSSGGSVTAFPGWKSILTSTSWTEKFRAKLLPGSGKGSMIVIRGLPVRVEPRVRHDGPAQERRIVDDRLGRVVEHRGPLEPDVVDDPVEPVLVEGPEQIAMIGERHRHLPRPTSAARRGEAVRPGATSRAGAILDSEIQANGRG